MDTKYLMDDHMQDCKRIDESKASESFMRTFLHGDIPTHRSSLYKIEASTIDDEAGTQAVRDFAQSALFNSLRAMG